MSKSLYSETMKEELFENIKQMYGQNGWITKAHICQVADGLNFPYPNFILTNKQYKVGRGQYMIHSNNVAPVATATLAPAAHLAAVIPMKQKIKTISHVDEFIPQIDKKYVPFGAYGDIVTIIKSSMFYPVFISGLSGNGKTTMVEQVCAKENRECYRVNISIETDEDALIGGNTLIDGNIVYREGPALMAMRRGAVLLLDEIDRGSNKLMCLQAILEGKPFFNKKTGETVVPTKGFNVIATANTKGKGSDDGRYIAAQILDDAFIERFAITIEQEYPDSKIEKRIITNHMKSLGHEDADFCAKLTDWADIIRKTFEEGGVDELISTRRLIRIVEAYTMFNDRMKAIELCVNRFDEETKKAFLDLYSKLEPSPEVASEAVLPPESN